MQKVDIALNWSQIVGPCLGMVLVVGVYAAIHWLKRRARAARKERPPQQERLLRPAGYSLHLRLDELNDQRMSAATQLLLDGAFLGFVCSAVYPLARALLLGQVTLATVAAQPKSYLILLVAILTFSVVALTVRRGIRVIKLDDDLRHCRFGLRGEQTVAEALAEQRVAKAGYVAFHDVPGNGPWNVDHVVIGPGGIFVLETKARSRRKATRDQAEHEVLFDGKTLRFPWCEDHDAAKQAKRNADWVRQFVKDFAPDGIAVHPIVVVPGWYVKMLGDYPVKAMNAKYLAKHLISADRRFEPEQLRPVIRRFDERCRDLEF